MSHITTSLNKSLIENLNCHIMISVNIDMCDEH